MLHNTKAAEIHAANVKAGWWSDPKTGERRERNVGEMLMLVVSEIAEAAEGAEFGLMDDKLPHLPMFGVELADQNIRIFDLVGFHTIDIDLILGTIGDHESLKGETTPAAMLMRLVRHISAAMEGHRRGNRNDKHFPQFKLFHVGLAKAVRDAYVIANHFGYDLDAFTRQKIAFNSTREDHKVENRLKEGGKAY